MAKIIKIEDLSIEEKFVTIEGTVIQLWTPTSKKIHQTGLIKDETGIIKFTTWTSNEPLDVEENKSYAFIGFKVCEWDGRLNIQSARFSKIKLIMGEHQSTLEI
jgi:replication factor A1